MTRVSGLANAPQFHDTIFSIALHVYVELIARYVVVIRLLGMIYCNSNSWLYEH